MEENTTSQYRKAIIDRLKLIMEMTGFELDGFAELTQISKSHLYALLNGKKGLTVKTADIIGKSIGLKGSQILKMDYPIPGSIQKAPEVKKFHDTHKYNPEYFTKTKGIGSISYFFESTLLATNLFDNPVSVREIKVACADLGMELSSKSISQAVNYLVVAKKLVKVTKSLEKLNGESGTRQIGYFSNNKDNLD